MRKVLSTAIIVLFTYASLVTPWVEANFWEERRQAVHGRNGQAEGGNLVAQLPASIADALPGTQNALSLVTRTPDDVLGASVPSSQKADFRRLPKFLTSLPVAYGEIRQVHLARTPNRPIVVHVQDIHGYLDAQLNIAGMMEHISAGSPKPVLVGVEGATGAFDVSPFRAFPDREAMKDVSRFLLSKDMIAAPEYAAWTAPKELVLWGVEEPALYQANGQAYKDSLPGEKDLKASLDKMSTVADTLKDKIYPAHLRDMDQAAQGYHAGRLPLGKYLRVLLSDFAGRKAAFPNLDLFLETLAAEEKIDFKQVEGERAQLIRRLADALTPAEIRSLMERSLLYRSGALTYGAYYGHLQTLCRAKGVDLSKYPGMRDYIAYVLASEKIDKDGLFSELGDAERRAAVPFLATDEQKDLHEAARDLMVSRKAADFIMTPDDWAEMQGRLEQVKRLPVRLEAIARKAGVSFSAGSAGSFGELLSPSAAFSRAAMSRNQALTGRLMEKINSGDFPVSVLVAGGFHSEGIVDLLSKQDVSVVVVTPKIQEIKKGDNYLNFLREKAPLEQLFTADKITYAKAPVASAAAPLREGHDAAMTAVEVMAGVRAYINSAGRAMDAKLAQQIQNLFPGADVAFTPKPQAGALVVDAVVSYRGQTQVWTVVASEGNEATPAARKLSARAVGREVLSGLLGAWNVVVKTQARGASAFSRLTSGASAAWAKLLSSSNGRLILGGGAVVALIGLGFLAAPALRMSIGLALGSVLMVLFKRQPSQMKEVKNEMSWGAERWLNATQTGGEARVMGVDQPLSQAVARNPEVLGRWSRLLFGDTQPIFTKFLYTNFAPQVHMGFRREVDPVQFKGWLMAEQAFMRELFEGLSPETRADKATFDLFRQQFADWASLIAGSDWVSNADAPAIEGLSRFFPAEAQGRVADLFARIKANRNLISSSFHTVDLTKEAGNMLLSPAGVPHAIFGLSEQTHPLDNAFEALQVLYARLNKMAAEGASTQAMRKVVHDARLDMLRAKNKGEPKNEAWFPMEVKAADGSKQIVLVEPQQTSNTTFSFADFYTPFIFKEGAGMIFRKGAETGGLSQAQVEGFIDALKFEVTTPEQMRRTPQEVESGASAVHAKLFKVVDEAESWPLFTTYRVDLSGSASQEARWSGAHPDGSFQQIVVTQGQVTLSDAEGNTMVLSAGENPAAFIPATMAGGYTVTSSQDAQVLLFAVPVPGATNNPVAALENAQRPQTQYDRNLALAWDLFPDARGGWEQTHEVDGQTIKTFNGDGFIVVGDFLFIEKDHYYRDTARFKDVKGNPFVILANTMRMDGARMQNKYEGYLSAFALGPQVTLETILMMQAHPEMFRGKTVADLGAGDGILGYVALALGAEKIFAIERAPGFSMNTWDRVRFSGHKEERFVSIEKDFKDVTAGDLKGEKIDLMMGSLPHNGFPSETDTAFQDNWFFRMGQLMNPDAVLLAGGVQPEGSAPVYPSVIAALPGGAWQVTGQRETPSLLREREPSVLRIARAVRDRSPPSQETPFMPAVAPVVSPVRVLLADDDAMGLKALRRLVQGEMRDSVEITVADSGLRAQALMREKKFDMVVSDVEMPGMSGTQLAAWIGENEPGTGVVLLSGNADDPRIAANALAAGAIIYPRPYDSATVLNHIRAVGLRPSPEATAAVAEVLRRRGMSRGAIELVNEALQNGFTKPAERWFYSRLLRLTGVRDENFSRVLHPWAKMTSQQESLLNSLTTVYASDKDDTLDLADSDLGPEAARLLAGRIRAGGAVVLISAKTTQELLEVKNRKTGVPGVNIYGALRDELVKQLADQEGIRGIQARLAADALLKDLFRFYMNTGGSVSVPRFGAKTEADLEVDRNYTVFYDPQTMNRISRLLVEDIPPPLQEALESARQEIRAEIRLLEGASKQEGDHTSLDARLAGLRAAVAAVPSLEIFHLAGDKSIVEKLIYRPFGGESTPRPIRQTLADAVNTVFAAEGIGVDANAAGSRSIDLNMVVKGEKLVKRRGLEDLISRGYGQITFVDNEIYSGNGISAKLLLEDLRRSPSSRAKLTVVSADYLTLGQTRALWKQGVRVGVVAVPSDLTADQVGEMAAHGVLVARIGALRQDGSLVTQDMPSDRTIDALLEAGIQVIVSERIVLTESQARSMASKGVVVKDRDGPGPLASRFLMQSTPPYPLSPSAAQLADAQKIVSNIGLTQNLISNNGVPDVIGAVSGSPTAQAYWDSVLQETARTLNVQDSLSLHEDLPVNQAFGLLLTWQRLRDQLKGDKGALMAFVFGDGTRSTPFTETDNAQKPAIATYSRDASGRHISIVELAMQYFLPVQQYLVRSGFRGFVVKWGDELQIPTLDLSGSDPLFKDADIVRFVSMQEMTADEAKNKDWVGVDAAGNVTAFIPRRELAQMESLADRGLIRRAGKKLIGGVNLGSIAVSGELGDALLAEFAGEVNDPAANRKERPDLDPQFFTALTIAAEKDVAARQEAWQRALGESAAMADMAKKMPDLLQRLVKVLADLETRRGRPVKIVAMDFQKQFWGDMGQHAKIHDFYMSLNDRGVRGDVARTLAGISHERDARGNIIVDSFVPSDARVYNSVLVGVKIAGKASISGSVLVGTRAGDISIHGGFDVLSRAAALSVEERGGTYKVVSGQPVEVGFGERATTLFTEEDGAPVLMKIKEWTDISADGKKAYSLPLGDNPISFQQAHAAMGAMTVDGLKRTREDAEAKVLLNIPFHSILSKGWLGTFLRVTGATYFYEYLTAGVLLVSGFGWSKPEITSRKAEVFNKAYESSLDRTRASHRARDVAIALAAPLASLLLSVVLIVFVADFSSPTLSSTALNFVAFFFSVPLAAIGAGNLLWISNKESRGYRVLYNFGLAGFPSRLGARGPPTLPFASVIGNGNGDSMVDVDTYEYFAEEIRKGQNRTALGNPAVYLDLTAVFPVLEEDKMPHPSMLTQFMETLFKIANQGTNIYLMDDRMDPRITSQVEKFMEFDPAVRHMVKLIPTPVNNRADKLSELATAGDHKLNMYFMSRATEQQIMQFMSLPKEQRPSGADVFGKLVFAGGKPSLKKAQFDASTAQNLDKLIEKMEYEQSRLISEWILRQMADGRHLTDEEFAVNARQFMERQENFRRYVSHHTVLDSRIRPNGAPAEADEIVDILFESPLEVLSAIVDPISSLQNGNGAGTTMSMAVMKGGRGFSGPSQLFTELRGLSQEVVNAATDDGRSAAQNTTVFSEMPFGDGSVQDKILDSYFGGRDTTTGVPDLGKALLDLSENPPLTTILGTRMEDADKKPSNEEIEAGFTKFKASYIEPMESILKGIQVHWGTDAFGSAMQKLTREEQEELATYITEFWRVANDPSVKKALDEYPGYSQRMADFYGNLAKERKMGRAAVEGVAYEYSVEAKKSPTLDLTRMPLRSIVLIGARVKHGDWQKAISSMERMLKVKKGHVYRATDRAAHLVSILKGGDFMPNENAVNEVYRRERSQDIYAQFLSPRPFTLDEIKEIYSFKRLEDRVAKVKQIITDIEKVVGPIRANPEVVRVFREADGIVLGVTTYASNIWPALLLPEVQQAIRERKGPLILVGNPTRENEPKMPISGYVKSFARLIQGKRPDDPSANIPGGAIDYLLGRFSEGDTDRIQYIEIDPRNIESMDTYLVRMGLVRLDPTDVTGRVPAKYDPYRVTKGVLSLMELWKMGYMIDPVSHRLRSVAIKRLMSGDMTPKAAAEEFMRLAERYPKSAVLRLVEISNELKHWYTGNDADPVQKREILEKVLDFYEGLKYRVLSGTFDPAVSRDLQALSQQALHLREIWTQPGISHDLVKEARFVTAHPGNDMIRHKGFSFISYKSVPAKMGVANAEGEMGLYDRGVELLPKMGELQAVKDAGALAKVKDSIVLYLMLHGWLPVTHSAMRKAIESGRVTPIHKTGFLHYAIPGALDLPSTGAGHYQKNNLDVKQVTQGKGIQFNVKFDKYGNVLHVIASEVKAGDFFLALPGYVDYVVNAGGLHFDDFSVRLTAAERERLQKNIAQLLPPEALENGTGEVDDDFKPAVAPYAVLGQDGEVTNFVRANDAVPEIQWMSLEFNRKSLAQTYVLTKDIEELVRELIDSPRKAYPNEVPSSPVSRAPIGFSDLWPRSWAYRPALRAFATAVESLLFVGLSAGLTGVAVGLLGFDLSDVLSGTPAEAGRALFSNGALLSLLGATGTVFAVFTSPLVHGRQLFTRDGWVDSSTVSRAPLAGVGAAMGVAFLAAAMATPLLASLVGLTLSTGQFLWTAGALSLLPATGAHLWLTARRLQGGVERRREEINGTDVFVPANLADLIAPAQSRGLATATKPLGIQVQDLVSGLAAGAQADPKAFDAAFGAHLGGLARAAGQAAAGGENAPALLATALDYADQLHRALRNGQSMDASQREGFRKAFDAGSRSTVSDIQGSHNTFADARGDLSPARLTDLARDLGAEGRVVLFVDPKADVRAAIEALPLESASRTALREALNGRNPRLVVVPLAAGQKLKLTGYLNLFGDAKLPLRVLLSDPSLVDEADLDALMKLTRAEIAHWLISGFRAVVPASDMGGYIQALAQIATHA